MKRIILLLLVLSCFRFSYGEELSAEQQQLAWKFIYDNMLSKEYLPNIFREDITINLKGEITSADSIVVKDLIKNFQKAIPHLKLELSDKPGNLILGLNDGKNNRVTTNMQANHSITSMEMYFPSSLTDSQKKQFIYFHLFKGLTLYNWSKQPFDGLGGCVFAEKDFKSITFSPFDLFILEKLYAPDFSIQLSRNLSPDLQLTAWSSILTKFMGETNDPLTFRGNIFIKLMGDVSPKDSLIFKRTINELKELLPSENDIVFTDSEANLTFTINAPGVKSRKKQLDNGEKITIHELEIIIPRNADDEQRLKIIYSYLYRSLVHFSPAYGGSQKVPGCVFDEENSEAITFHPLDKFILSKLYAPDFKEQFKDYYVKKNSLVEFYKYQLENRVTIIGISLLTIVGIAGGLILAVLLISVLIMANVFRGHNWKFSQFLSQVVWGIIAFDIFSLFSQAIQNLSFSLPDNTWSRLLIVDLIVFFFAVIFFFSEKKIQFSTFSSKAKSMLVLGNTMIMSFAVSFTLGWLKDQESGIRMLVTPILIMLSVTTVRFFLISLSATSRAEIKQKEEEITLLKEKNKQAELDSLRAKINPHFLYNALNSIASLATTDARKTEQMALALSDFFKYAINREQKQLNTLSEELNATRTYLEIEKVRFGDLLSFEIDCPAELLNIQIPQLLIQPLVENAIKHGLSQITENGLIRISVSRSENQLKIRVYDNGPAFPDGPLTGFGIQNTQERIALLYGQKATVNWENGKEKYIELCLPIGNESV